MKKSTFWLTVGDENHKSSLCSGFDQAKELRYDLMVGGFAVKVRDEIVGASDEEKESIDEHDHDDGVAAIEVGNARAVTRTRGVTPGADTSRHGGTEGG